MLLFFVRQTLCAIWRKFEGIRDALGAQMVNLLKCLVLTVCGSLQLCHLLIISVPCFLGFLEIEKLVLCTCEEPALQLLSRGLFPCAPSRPSLAVDLNMLDFARGLFVNTSPNMTAWCETLEGFLSARQFKLTTRVLLF